MFQSCDKKAQNKKPPSAREVARSAGGRETYHSPKYFTLADGSLPHPLARDRSRGRTPLSLRDISPHRGESPSQRGPKSRFSSHHHTSPRVRWRTRPANRAAGSACTRAWPRPPFCCRPRLTRRCARPLRRRRWQTRRACWCGPAHRSQTGLARWFSGRARSR